MTSSRLSELLQSITRARVGVVGDFCIDSYYIIDMARSEPSLETGIATHPVREQRHTLGGAGNVASNLRAMGAGSISAFGVIGADLLGLELLRLLESLGAGTAGMIRQQDGWQTHSYLKPIVNRDEGHRMDFGVFNEIAPGTTAALLAALEKALPALDVLIVNQQFENTLHSAAFQAGLNTLLAAHPRVTALVDCRSSRLADAYSTGLRKLNDLEATRLCGLSYNPRDTIPRRDAIDSATRLFAQWKKPVFVTRGKHGCIVVDAAGAHEIPGLHIINKTDSVGAGDSMVSGIAACLAIGASPAEAADFGNFVAGVTVQKLHQTGTASPAEILAIGGHADYVYQPELADDIRRASHAPGTAIEIAGPLPAAPGLRFAIFDHDGTISTLRQGWEKVMEPMMIRAILGPAYETADSAAYERVVQQSREFIDKTTGIQTLQQMHGLSLMVREAGFVPESEILDAPGYKRIYNDALMELVRERKRQLDRGELDVTDFTLKNAVPLLHRLHDAGIKMFLASGTDEQDVLLEAEALGYARLFEGRIYGANQDMTHDAKRMVLERILGEIGPGDAAHIVTFGDGPVEIRETRKRGGLTVGIASNEVQRFGLAPEKRTRVIRAGAHLVVPDYSQLDALLSLLKIKAKAAA
ncbi:MAG: PfkB family carbohydrate kinase [Opitutaceae bacterium]|jgi:bifunctional ADP-heptose synthase (sugar kinase/adenylyltransferase)/phosphoglycolate phosphatase-like HAD superfamily hydrolase|nr:PfkB family carbohydrate kinase [Opitutaceae bacterium]